MAAHIPVMLNEVIGGLAPKDDGVYIDGTFGRGGYSAAILDAAATRVWGIDRDPTAVTFGLELSQRFDGRLTVLEGKFGDMQQLMSEAGVHRVDGVTLDIGVSSPQLDDPVRGFSFQADGPLDMRMSDAGPTAADFVNGAPESELADVIHDLGEERYARRIARAIVSARDEAAIATTTQLAGIVRRVVRRSRDGIDPATRTFLALRIQVNDELGELDAGLRAAEGLLVPGGRLAVVAFHSLEDRRVKDFLRTRSGFAAAPSRHMPPPALSQEPSFRLIDRGVTKPRQTEVNENPRARSARLRVAERTTAPAWPIEASV